MIQKEILKKIYQRTNEQSRCNLSKYACKDTSGRRLKKEDEEDFRTCFSVDRDRILHSGAYRRYQGKTQVFSFSNLFDEEMTNRSLHTTYVSQISRTIGRVLGLNLELIEAIALGHDLGHTPFGHDGEKALSYCCEDYDIGEFHHNVESLYIVDYVAKHGQGLNLTFQVRDGIISHDGEVHNTSLHPNRNKTEADLNKYIEMKKVGGNDPEWMPATLEGCVVRITDTIAYIGQDIEDAIRYNILKREDLPRDCVEYLGDRNSVIIDTLIKSVIQNSYEKDFVSFDDETSSYLKKLKDFNYERIYKNDLVKSGNGIIDRAVRLLFDKYITDIKNGNKESKVFVHFLNTKNDEYMDRFSHPEMVRDFIATMTDRYFNEEAKAYLIPWSKK